MVEGGGYTSRANDIREMTFQHSTEEFMIEKSLRNTLCGVVAGGALLALTAIPARAQQATGTPGSPEATTTIPGNQLPPPPQKFEGKIERNAAQSTPYWPARVVP